MKREVSTMIKWIENPRSLEDIQGENGKAVVLLFYGDLSSPAKRAVAELEQFSEENKEINVYALDVVKVKGVHKKYGVNSVPTVIALQKGKVTQMIKGVQSAQYYGRIFAGVQSISHKPGAKTVTHRVVVYSTPTCPACNTAKAYFRRRGIRFRDVDVSRDQQAAESLVRRSGQQAVPQIDIDGNLIVGFDQTRIEKLISN